MRVIDALAVMLLAISTLASAGVEDDVARVRQTWERI